MVRSRLNWPGDLSSAQPAARARKHRRAITTSASRSATSHAVPAEDDLPLPESFLVTDSYFQLATRPLFQLWDNEPLTQHLRTQASPEQIRLFAVYTTDNDITNGGLWQWLGNSYSCLYPSLLEGHRMLGLPGIADLIEDAVRQMFPDNNLPLDHDTHTAALNILVDS